MDVKQVIVIRKDLKMRRGKEISQGAHAAMSWLTNRLCSDNDSDSNRYGCLLTAEEQSWVKGRFTKIVLQVDSETELIMIYKIAKRAGLTVELIEDAGITEFDGPTITCLAIGPNHSYKIDAVTQHLKLY